MKKIDKKFLYDNYGSSSKVKEVLEFIKDDKNWIYDLFDFVHKKVSLFINKMAYPDKELEKSLDLIIFGNCLLTMIETKSEKYLTYVYPLRNKNLNKTKSYKEKGKDVIGLILLNNYDDRRLIKKSVRELIIRHLDESEFFINRLKKSEKIFLGEIHLSFKENKSLKETISILVSEIERLKKIKSPIKNKNNSESKVGTNPLYESREEFEAALKLLSKEVFKSKRKIAKALKIAPNTAGKYIEMYFTNLKNLQRFLLAQK